MAITFSTTAPEVLLKMFDARISQHEQKGKITTWEKSKDGVYYTHKAAEWAKKAWLKPTIKSQRLTFNIIKPQNSNVSVAVYGYYHGHLVETFLNHFDAGFGEGSATASPTSDDRVR
jgi:hypothetical protein